MKSAAMASSLVLSLVLYGCSDLTDDQKTATHTPATTASASQTYDRETKSAVTNASRPRSAIAPLQVVTEHFATSDKNSNGNKLHELFLKDVDGGSWAYQGESLLKQRLNTLASSTTVEIAQIECRSTMCEVLATARNPENISTDVDRWQDSVYGYRSQLEQAGMSIEGTEFSQNANGEMVIVTHLIRKKEAGSQQRI